MKIIIVCLIAILVCSCRQTIDSSPSKNYNKMTRHDEILKIMRENTIRDLENNAYWLTSEEREELRRLKKDYYAVTNYDSHTALVIPGRGWEIRGPLTVAQFEDELIELYEESSKSRKKVYGITERFEDSEIGKDCGLFKRQYSEGDELYFFKSDERSWAYLCGREGYVLIRNNKMVDKIVTAIN